MVSYACGAPRAIEPTVTCGPGGSRRPCLPQPGSEASLRFVSTSRDTAGARTAPSESRSPAQYGLEKFRRRVFIVASLVGALATVINPLVFPESAFDLIVSPAVAGGLIMTAIITDRSRRIPAGVTWAIPIGVMCYILLRMIHLLFSSSAEHRAPEAALFAPWGPIILMMAWILFMGGPGLWLTIVGYYVALLVPAVVYVAVRPAAPEALGIIVSLMLSGGAATALLGPLVRLRESQAREGALREATERMAHIDFLTGLPNRRCLAEALARECARAYRRLRPLGVILFDLDRFRRINDHFGHQVGDEALVGVAKHVGACMRDADLFGRWAGEEFLIIAPETGAAEAMALATRIRGSLGGCFATAGIELTASFGVVTLRLDDTQTTLLARADDALYRAKERGRNSVAGDQ